MKYLLFISFLYSCSTQKLPLRRDAYLIIQRAFLEKVPKADLIKEFGPADIESGNGLIYNVEETNYPKIGLFFNDKNQLSSAFFMAADSELEQIKKSIPCEWQEKIEGKKRSHYERRIKHGLCQQYQIAYYSLLNSNTIEIKWGNLPKN